MLSKIKNATEYASETRCLTKRNGNIEKVERVIVLSIYRVKVCNNRQIELNTFTENWD